MNAHYKARVVLLNLPIRPLSALAYYVAFKANLIHPDAVVRFCEVSSGKESWRGMFESGMILDLTATGGPIAADTLRLIDTHIPREKSWFVRRCASYFQPGKNYSRAMYNHLAAIVMANDSAPIAVCDEIVHLFSRWEEFGDDPWEQNFPIARPILPTGRKPEIPRDRKVIDLPFFMDFSTVTNFETEDDLKGIRTETIHEGRAWHLQNRCVKVMVGGFEGRGKSTVAFSVYKIISNILASVSTRSGWEGFKCSVGLLDLDLGTPTSDIIRRGLGQDAAYLKSLKRPWTTARVIEASEQLESATRKHNIVISDLPGRLTNFTETLASQADVAIILAGGDYVEERGIWRDFFKELSVPVISRIRSRHKDERMSSMIRHFDPGRCVSGRVTSLDRNQRSFDPFLMWLSELMLFSILPEFHLRRQRAVEEAYLKT